MKFDNDLYDTLKWIALYLLPAFATFFSVVGGIWGLPHVEAIVGTISAFDIFLAKLLDISSDQYEGDGTLYILRTDEKDTYRMMLNDDINTLGDKSSVTFKVMEGYPE